MRSSLTPSRRRCDEHSKPAIKKLSKLLTISIACLPSSRVRINGRSASAFLIEPSVALQNKRANRLGLVPAEVRWPAASPVSQQSGALRKRHEPSVAAHWRGGRRGDEFDRIIAGIVDPHLLGFGRSPSNPLWVGAVGDCVYAVEVSKPGEPQHAHHGV